jgi:hypothetical protein
MKRRTFFVLAASTGLAAAARADLAKTLTNDLARLEPIVKRVGVKLE